MDLGDAIFIDDDLAHDDDANEFDPDDEPLLEIDADELDDIDD